MKKKVILNRTRTWHIYGVGGGGVKNSTVKGVFC